MVWEHFPYSPFFDAGRLVYENGFHVKWTEIVISDPWPPGPPSPWRHSRDPKGPWRDHRYFPAHKTSSVPRIAVLYCTWPYRNRLTGPSPRLSSIGGKTTDPRGSPGWRTPRGQSLVNPIQVRVLAGVDPRKTTVLRGLSTSSVDKRMILTLWD